GVESWIASLRDSRASLSVAPENALASMIRATFGPTCIESLKKRSRASCFSKTSLACSLFDAPMEGQRPSWSSMNWPDLVTRLRRDCSRRLKLARRTFVSGCSSSAQWQTPDAQTMNDGTSPEAWKRFKATSKAKHRNGNGHGTTLAIASRLWTTPQAHDQTERGRGQTTEKNGAGNACLARDARIWPTPKGRDTKGQSQRGEYGLVDALPNMAENFHCSPPAPQNSTNGAKSSTSTRRLNPRFVLWLMGWPIGATGCDCSAT